MAIKLPSLLVKKIRTFLSSYREEIAARRRKPREERPGLERLMDPTTANALSTGTVVLRKRSSKAKNSPYDGVPLSNYRMRPSDVQAEVFDWICHYLWLKNCPVELATIVASTISANMSSNLDQQHQSSPDTVDGSPPAPALAELSASSCSSPVPSLEVQHPTPDRSSLPSALCSLDLARQSRELVDEFLDELATDVDQAVAMVDQYVSPEHQQFTASIHAMKNRRTTMEDRHVIIPNLNKTLNLELAKTYSYYAIFDGHAGLDAASFATAHLHHYLVESPAFAEGRIEEAFQEAFKKTDELYIKRLKEDGLDKLRASGTTALCALIEDNRIVYLAWAGDSQAVLVRNGQHEEVMLPHKPDLESERIRIQEQGGFVIYVDTWRVNGVLSVTRAIGDPEHKTLIIADPSFSKFDIDSSLDFLVLGCDGLFDHLTGQDITSHVFEFLCKNENRDPEQVMQEVSSYLSTVAVQEGSSDNITAIVIFFKPFQQLVATGFTEPSENGLATAAPSATLPTTNGGHFPYTDFSELPIGTSFKLSEPEPTAQQRLDDESPDFSLQPPAQQAMDQMIDMMQQVTDSASSSLEQPSMIIIEDPGSRAKLPDEENNYLAMNQNPFLKDGSPNQLSHHFGHHPQLKPGAEPNLMDLEDSDLLSNGGHEEQEEEGTSAESEFCFLKASNDIASGLDGQEPPVLMDAPVQDSAPANQPLQVACDLNATQESENLAQVSEPANLLDFDSFPVVSADQSNLPDANPFSQPEAVVGDQLLLLQPEKSDDFSQFEASKLETSVVPETSSDLVAEKKLIVPVVEPELSPAPAEDAQVPLSTPVLVEEPKPVPGEEPKCEPIPVEEQKHETFSVEELKPEPVVVEEPEPEPAAVEEPELKPVSVEESEPKPVVPAEKPEPEHVPVEEPKSAAPSAGTTTATVTAVAAAAIAAGGTKPKTSPAGLKSKLVPGARVPPGKSSVASSRVAATAKASTAPKTTTSTVKPATARVGSTLTKKPAATGGAATSKPSAGTTRPATTATRPAITTTRPAITTTRPTTTAGTRPATTATRPTTAAARPATAAPRSATATASRLTATKTTPVAKPGGTTSAVARTAATRTITASTKKLTAAPTAPKSNLAAAGTRKPLTGIKPAAAAAAAQTGSSKPVAISSSSRLLAQRKAVAGGDGTTGSSNTQVVSKKVASSISSSALAPKPSVAQNGTHKRSNLIQVENSLKQELEDAALKSQKN